MMQFHTWSFAIFFTSAYTIYLALRPTRFRNLWILTASYTFYALWNPLYLGLIVWSTSVDYITLLMMERKRHKKICVTISILNNLLLLGFFKYSLFVTDNINLILEKLNSSFTLSTPTVLLPIGLSFYVFKSIGYVIDCYRGDIRREKNIITHAAFVSFFPVLLAGPIERASNLLVQFNKTPKIGCSDISQGLSLFVVGLFKKIALADCLALYVNNVYDQPSQFHSPALIMATVAFAWQIYFDFSGYTDMARGLAKAMGFNIMQNFNHPYLATGLGDFWQRWHISLSTWFRDYVYIPLGGNRTNKFNTYRNIFLTMVISGLWHGAAWTFVIWGALHAIGMICTRELERSSFYKDRFPKLVKQIIVFVFVSFAWIFFRSSDLSTANLILNRIFTSGISNPRFPILLVILISVIWIYQYIHESRIKQILKPAPFQIILVILMILYMTLFAPSSGQAFIYNQF